MRRTTVAGLALGLAAPLLHLAPSHADRLPDPPVATAPAAQETHGPRRALERAEATLAGDPAAGDPREATLAMRDLFASLPSLSRAERRRAEVLLARPTQGSQDPWGDGYRARSVRTCDARVCVHRVRRTSDRAGAAWARRTLRVMGRTWRKEVGGMGYRRPLRDGRRGGNAKLDVYLADVGADGLFGYCAPETTRPGNKRLASGYCVLDNDFARDQFGARPTDSLEATAAHEFFHAIQFAYDYREDPWLMEATATWMEERAADGVNDNRRYLRHGQVRRTWVPLDRYSSSGAGAYGNWAFFEYLSQRFGATIVRRTWRNAGHADGDGGHYSTRALVQALPRRTSFPRVYGDFQAANVRPDHSYPEGGRWPRPRLAADELLGADAGREGTPTIDHLSGLDFRLRPKAALEARSWRLRVRVDGPPPSTSPVVSLVRLTSSDHLVRTRLRLDGEGNGQVSVPFSTRQTEAVWVVLGNASTRFRCRGRYVVGYSCGGDPRDDDRTFRLTLQTWSKD